MSHNINNVNNVNHSFPSLIDIETYKNLKKDIMLIHLEYLIEKKHKYINRIRKIEMFNIWNEFMIIYGPTEGNDIFMKCYFS